MKFINRIFFFLIAFLLIQCDNPPVSPINIESELHKGGKGGGGHTETQSNNLSFPALLADGVTLSNIDESLTVPYDGNYEGLTAEEIAALGDQLWYAQKVEGNEWQAEFKPFTPNTSVTFIDWGDAMESVNPKLRRPYRVEFGIYVELAGSMEAYTMALLANPSSKDETQGTNGFTYPCDYATIASPKGRVVIQRYDVDEEDLTWNAAEGKWEGAYEPESGFGFQQELNVGGKYIYGASSGGFKPTVAGTYRITFYFQGSEVSLVEAKVGDYNNGEPIIPKIGERNTAVVYDINDLTYMDVQATGGGSGGKGGGSKGKGK